MFNYTKQAETPVKLGVIESLIELFQQVSHANSAAANLLFLFSVLPLFTSQQIFLLRECFVLLSPLIKVTTGTPLHLLNVTTIQNLFVSFLSSGLTVHKTVQANVL